MIRTLSLTTVCGPDPLNRSQRVGDDMRYCRVDFSSKLAHEARVAFVKNVKKGETLADIGSAALQICSEDDAIISNSPVEFPIQSYLQRLRSLSRTVASNISSRGKGSPLDSIVVIEDVLFNVESFSYPQWGSSNLPKRSFVDHPGVWENQSYGYLHELLITRRGIPSLLGILYQHIMKLLLFDGVIDFVVSFDYGDFSRLPKAQLIPGMCRQHVIQSKDTMLNLCTFDVLFDVLYFLKRSFWPFAWDSNDLKHGGFRQGSQSVLYGGASAELEAISRSAEHRLSRGIWTTTGGGDIRRALAACERLVLLNGAQKSLDRRDLGLLYYFAGNISGCFAELSSFEDASGNKAQEMEDRRLTNALLEKCQHSGISNLGSVKPLSVDTFLEKEAPDIAFLNNAALTW